MRYSSEEQRTPQTRFPGGTASTEQGTINESDGENEARPQESRNCESCPPSSTPELSEQTNINFHNKPLPIGHTNKIFFATASWYGRKFHGRRTASGETYNMHEYTAAHRTLPFGTRVRVTNLRNGRQTLVRINDRGPFVSGRDIDLSYQAAQDLRMIGTGVEKVELEIIPG
ncbi:MAG: septal ring lytic transglycosylase RlpA family protein [Candidatus Abyssobacteria bacterium SURF_17]|uniref:Probable endolytic peptidoglycan transglycosylase RlpA n=1 Tax=Candidatus Abyssobacteria bacterium SURF_17 TaxID=2093361 RepID=A0A419EZT2_9BACT|nr:MAG: septal ring lytic transglycosylase RlpA family protein [Candidatus Abyssubacteria bacterium SURF_17]